MNEFAYAGEITTRPETAPSLAELMTYVHLRRNVAGVQREWWFHRFGCETWFQAERDTLTNAVLSTEVPRTSRGAPVAPEAPAKPDTPAV